MAASEAVVTAVMETLGCERRWFRRLTGEPEPRMSLCDMHDEDWTDRGCPVAVAAADAVERIVKVETLALARDLADEWDRDYPIKGRVAWYSRELRDRADRIEGL